MGKKKPLNKVQRAQIVALQGENLSKGQIAVKIGFSKTAVHQAIAKYREDGVFTDKERTGRWGITTAREDLWIMSLVMGLSTNSTKKIRAALFRIDVQTPGNGHMTDLRISAQQCGPNFLH